MLLIHTIRGFNDYLSCLQKDGIKPRLYRLYDKLVIDNGNDDDSPYIDDVDGSWIDVSRSLLKEEIDEHHARSLIIQEFQLPNTDVMNMFRDRLNSLLSTHMGKKCEMDILCSHVEHVQMVMFMYFNLFSVPDSVPIPGGIRYEWTWLYKY